MIKNKLKILLLLFSIVYWIIVAFYFVTIRYYSLGELAPPLLDYKSLMGYSLAVGFSIGLLFGLFPLSNILQFKKRTSFITIVLFGTSCYVIFFIIVVFMASLYGNSAGFALSYVFSGGGLTVLFHLSVCSLLYHFILQINKKFGPDVLLEYSLGKYFTPKVEERVFMFIDLKSSTQLAEKLEHVSYSRMIQDCYAELTEPLILYKAQVYQYVGDEVVVSWKKHRHFSADICFNFFYAFRKKMEERKEYFLLNYGAYPEFKAGAHCGKVTVAEVGEIKTEIAYHGDTLNTAARIQSLCNSFKKDLLFSESLLQLLPAKKYKQAAFIAETSLRGKESPTKIYTYSSL